MEIDGSVRLRGKLATVGRIAKKKNSRKKKKRIAKNDLCLESMIILKGNQPNKSV
jgi:hypothetical protein